jgi:3-methyladenine DNA glycosylase AlkD
MPQIQSFLTHLRTQLTQSIDLTHKQNYSRRFKEDIKVYGIKTPTLKIIIKQNRTLIKDLPKGQIWEICEELHKSDFCEESFIASAFSHKLNKYYEKEDFQIFQKWIEEYINNRAKCDTFCNHTM